MTVTNKSPVEGQLRRRTYVTCLQCGEELAYNWQEMKAEGPSFGYPLRSKIVSIAAGRLYERTFRGGSPKLTRSEAARKGWVVLEAGKHQPVTRLMAK